MNQKTVLINEHNKLIRDIINCSNKNDISKQDFINLLNKYAIDVNYDDSVIISLVATNSPVNYEAVRYLLELGADPNLIMDNDLLASESSIIQKLRLDAIFKSFGYKCDWPACKGKFH